MRRHLWKCFCGKQRGLFSMIHMSDDLIDPCKVVVQERLKGESTFLLADKTRSGEVRITDVDACNATWTRYIERLRLKCCCFGLLGKLPYKVQTTCGRVQRGKACGEGRRLKMLLEGF